MSLERYTAEARKALLEEALDVEVVIGVTDGIAFDTARGRWVVLAAVLGSGVAFLDGTVVTPRSRLIAKDLDVGLSSLQWTLTAYLLTLGSLLVVGGSIGDLFGRRRVFVADSRGSPWRRWAARLRRVRVGGCIVVARCAQGAGRCSPRSWQPGPHCRVVPRRRPRSCHRCVVGPCGHLHSHRPVPGGWLIDSVSWRYVFVINVPIVAVAIAVTLRHVPESRDEDAKRHVDVSVGWRCRSASPVSCTRSSRDPPARRHRGRRDRGARRRRARRVRDDRDP